MKHKYKKIRVQDLILRLRKEKGNKLSKRRANSFNISPKANIIK